MRTIVTKFVHSGALQRVGPAAGLPALMSELGVEPEAAFAGLAIGPGDLVPDNRVPFESLVQLLDRAVRLTGCPSLGLLLGSRNDHRSLGLVGAMMRQAPTLRDALLDFVGMQISNSRGAVVYLHRMEQDYALGYGIYDRQLVGSSPLYDLSLAIGCNIVRALTNGRYQPTEVLVAHSAPADPRPYLDFFKVPVHFDQNQSCLILSASALDAKMAGADPNERARLRNQIRTLMQKDIPNSAARVRHLIRPALAKGDPSLAAIARQLDLHPKALARLLAADGSTFRGLLAEVRHVMAQELLAATDLPIGDIASALCYANHSAFVHAFKTWTALPPSVWRDQARAM